MMIAYDLVLLDLQLDDQCGFVVMDYLSVKKIDTQVIVVTGLHSEEKAIAALKKGVADYLKKPFEPDALLASVNNVMKLRKDERERERLNTVIETSRERFRRVIDSQRDLVCRLNRDFVVTFANKAFADTFGTTPPDMIGRAYQTLTHDAIKHTLFDKLKALRSGSRPIRIEYKCIHASGCSRYLQWHYQGVLDEQGNVVEIQCAGRDVTREKLVYRQLAEKRLQAERKKLTQARVSDRRLNGMLPICASCKMIRDDNGSWNQIESYIAERSEAEFSHDICPQCARQLYPELYEEEKIT
jgi:PAS domain S-box-containing protein